MRTVDFAFHLGYTKGKRAPAAFASSAFFTLMGELSTLDFAFIQRV
jgi:hypothetical protein